MFAVPHPCICFLGLTLTFLLQYICLQSPPTTSCTTASFCTLGSIGYRTSCSAYNTYTHAVHATYDIYTTAGRIYMRTVLLLYVRQILTTHNRCCSVHMPYLPDVGSFGSMIYTCTSTSSACDSSPLHLLGLHQRKKKRHTAIPAHPSSGLQKNSSGKRGKP